MTPPPNTPLITHLTADARSLPVPSSTIDCIVTSPPYNCAIDYPTGHDDTMDWTDYIGLVHRSCAEMYRVARVGSRAWVNVAPTVPMEVGNPRAGRCPLLKLGANALASMGWQYRDTVVWIQDSFDGGTAWGSWRSPSSPNLRGSWEAILVVFKDNWERVVPQAHAGHRHTFTYVDRASGERKTRHRTINAYRDTGEDWPELCRNVWTINPSRDPAFPATFPEELPRRAIRLSTWPGDLVLDPFAGSCTTGRVAEELGRRSLLVDVGWGTSDD